MKCIKINNIDVYPIKISNCYKELRDLKQIISKDETLKANQYYTKELTNSYIICRGSLRRVLGEYIGLPPKHIKFDYNFFGKPGISKAINKNNIKFNISHSDDYCLIAVTENYEIGVDIEFVKPLDDYVTIAEIFFSPKEAALINSLNDFYTIWAQKEAVIKASGKGVSFGLNHWSTNLKEKNYNIIIESVKYRVTSFNIDDKYSSALCVI